MNKKYIPSQEACCGVFGDFGDSGDSGDFSGFADLDCREVSGVEMAGSLLSEGSGDGWDTGVEISTVSTGPKDTAGES